MRTLKLNEVIATSMELGNIGEKVICPSKFPKSKLKKCMIFDGKSINQIIQESKNLESEYVSMAAACIRSINSEMKSHIENYDDIEGLCPNSK
jgi:hypothetical protein